MSYSHKSKGRKIYEFVRDIIIIIIFTLIVLVVPIWFQMWATGDL